MCGLCFVRRGDESLLSSGQDGLPTGRKGECSGRGAAGTSWGVAAGAAATVTPSPAFSLAGLPWWWLWGPPRCLPRS